jgi:hypothetical protein
MTKGDAASSDSRDHIRIAAFLLFTASGIGAAISVVQAHWGWKPNAFGVVQIVGEAILATCLLLFRRKRSNLLWPFSWDRHWYRWFGPH